MSKSEKKILVTGFQAFGGESINPSEVLLQSLKEDFQHQEQFQFLLLPVAFRESTDILLQTMIHNHFDVLLLLGQAGDRENICLERVALNWVDSKHADELGFHPKAGFAVEDAPAAYMSSLPLSAWQSQLEGLGFPVKVSLSAGSFVCNHLYFQTLHKITTKALESKAVFVHVPYLPTQTVDKVNKFSLELSVMLAALRELLDLVSKAD